jgi:hypothetical protein
MGTVLLALLLLASTVAIVLLWRRNRELTATYSPIIDAHGEVRRATTQAEQLRAAAAAEAERLRTEARTETERLRADAAAALIEHTRQREALSRDYADARALHDRLRNEIALLEKNLEDISVGLYKPHYHYDSSEAYRAALETIRHKQKGLIKSGRAASCGKTWNIAGDARRRAHDQAISQTDLTRVQWRVRRCHGQGFME